MYYVITRRRDLHEVKNTRAMRGPDCQTDHYIVKSTLKIAVKPIYFYSKQKSLRKRKLDTNQLGDPARQEHLQQEIARALGEIKNEESPQKAWETLSSRVYSTAVETLGYTKKRNADWFDENNQVIKLAIDERNRALMAKLSNPTEGNKQKLKLARKNLQQNLRIMENDWWLRRAEEMQQMADRNSSSGFFNSLKEVYGPKAQMSNLLLSRDGNETLTDPNQLTQRWKEHFGALLNVESSTDDTALDHIDPLPERQHLNEEPTLQEVIKAIWKTKSNKSPGMDGIPAEVYKYGGTQLTGKVHELILMCWRQGIVPQEFKDVLIVPIYKNKGDHRDCNNYRGISLLAIAGKIMAKVIQSRLAQLAEEVLTASQCGFRRERSTIDMIFSLRQIQEKAIEQYQELYIVFIDFRKAFDSVDRDMLWRVLRRFGCPEHFVRMIEQFHTGAKGRVVVGQQESDQLDVNHGTKQGCVLAPTLFTLFLTTVLVSLHQELGNGIFVRTRADGKLFNLARLKARTKTREELISELLFADDTALVAHDVATMQNMVDIFSQASEKIGLQINKGKTEVLYQPSPDNTEPQPPIITINGEALKVVKSFKYLGSTVSDDARADQEISNRIQSACASYGKLEKRLWSRGGIRLESTGSTCSAVLSRNIHSV